MITTILFDFAGVLTTGKIYPKAAEVLGPKAGITPEEFLARLRAHESEYLRGNMSTEEFHALVCEGLDLSIKEFSSAIGAYSVNMDTVQFARELKERFATALVSDNYEALYQTIESDKAFKDLFNKSFYSHFLQLSKEDDAEKIFSHVLTEMDTEPEECIFIDDKEKNLIFPREIGMHTILFQSIDQVKADVQRVLDSQN